MINAVIGMGFGDEGKGCTVDWLCSLYSDSLVVRYSGGHQAGHHVKHDDKEHIFSNFGSGSLRGNPTYWSEKCTIDPVGIREEYKKLCEIGILPKLYINKNCPVTTPEDKLANMTNKTTLEHGSCGVGFFETLKRQKAMYSLIAGDLFCQSAMEFKYAEIQKFYDNVNTILSESFFESVEWMKRCNLITIVDGLPSNQSIIFEGSQGLLLDQNIGFFPHVTPSDVGDKYFRDEYISIDHHYFVTRAYQTRHGNGPMTDKGEIQFVEKEIFEKTNKENQFQNKMRATMLDLDLLKWGLDRNGKVCGDKTIVITCLEHLKVWSFWHDGQVFTTNSKKDFCVKIKNILEFDNVVMCDNYTFT